MPAQWDTYGRIAGPRRNRAMVVAAEQFALCGWDVRALAFPPGPSPGTRDFIREARKATSVKLEVVEL